MSAGCETCLEGSPKETGKGGRRQGKHMTLDGEATGKSLNDEPTVLYGLSCDTKKKERSERGKHRIGGGAGTAKWSSSHL